ncbi:MAG: peptidylprolyl isomerase [Flavobacteriales bacterium]|nr:peptidylprolyl isomerase [Flavobacteriales bacterium]
MQGISIFTFSFLFSLSLIAQPGNSEFQLLDGIVAVVGDEIILNSAIEDRARQARIEGGVTDESNKCGFLEELLFEKLLLHNARLDSLEVGDGEVMDEIERRLAYYIKMLGSVESFEAEYGKSVAQWKADFTEPILDQLLAQRMQQTISQEVRATPAEVLEYFEKTPVDSLPLIPEELSYSEIVLQPVISDEQKQAVRTTLDSVRNLVATGQLSMTLAATRYSEDPGSKYKGGCYENIARGVFLAEFEAAVFDTPVNGYSPVFETDFGYHFVRVTEKRGEQLSACPVLMTPRGDTLALENQNTKIDSIYASINAGSTTFEKDVLSFSTRESSKNSKGQVVNPRDGGLMFGIDELDPNLYFLLEPLEVGEMSSPVQLVDADGNGFWTILRLEARKAAHRANPKDDYGLFQSQVENNMRALDMNEWIDEHISDSFIRLSSEYINCEFNINWKQ